MVMQFNQNNIKIIFIAAITCLMPFNVYSMNADNASMVTPYVAPAIALGVGRYGPELSQMVVSRVLPENGVAAALVPPIIRYAGYGVGGCLISRNVGINPLDLAKGKKETYKTVAKSAINLSPALLCHPAVAQAANEYALSSVSNYLTPYHAELARSYGAPALMAAGACGAAYLANRNLAKGRLLSWQLLEDSKPYLFIAPMIGTIKRDLLTNYICNYLPKTIPNTIKSDASWITDKILLFGGIGLTAYLLAFETFGIANKKFFMRKFQEIAQSAQRLSQVMSGKLLPKATTIERDSAALNSSIIAHSQSLKVDHSTRMEQINEMKKLLKDIEVRNNQSLTRTYEFQSTLGEIVAQIVTLHNATQEQKQTGQQISEELGELEELCSAISELIKNGSEELASLKRKLNELAHMRLRMGLLMGVDRIRLQQLNTTLDYARKAVGEN